MMSYKGVFLLQTSSGWQITVAGGGDGTFDRLECEVHAEPDALAQSAEAYASERDLANRNIVIGVCSQSALTASFVASPEDQRNRSALKYELESFLPFAAEEFVADYVASGDRVLGVCVQIETWLPFVIELESRGWRVQSIVPVALMALQSYLTQATNNASEWILWHDEGCFELFECRDRVARRWVHWNKDPRAVARQLTVELLHQQKPLRCELINAEDGFTERITCVEFQRVETETLSNHALQSATSVLEGSASPLVELRREELAAGDPHRAVRGSLRLLFTAAAVFLVALTSALWIKCLRVNQELAELQQRQVAAFQQAFPRSRVPAAVLSRLRSEHAKLVGARSGKTDVELPVSALHVLFELLGALPEDQRYRFRELRIEDGRVDVDLELRSHNDANLLVSSFESRGFSVSAPASVQEGQRTVASRIFADIRSTNWERD